MFFKDTKAEASSEGWSQGKEEATEIIKVLIRIL